MAKTASLNNTYLGINGNILTGNTIPQPLPNTPRRPYDAGSLFLDFNVIQGQIDPNDYMVLESKFDRDFHNDTLSRLYSQEVEKARNEEDQMEYNERQFEFNENNMVTKNIKQRLLEIRNSMIPQADKDAKVMSILRDLGRQNMGAKRGLELLQNAYFELDMKPSQVVREEIDMLQGHVRDQPKEEQEQKVGTDKVAEDVDNMEWRTPKKQSGGDYFASSQKYRTPNMRGKRGRFNIDEEKWREFTPTKTAQLNQREVSNGVAAAAFAEAGAGAAALAEVTPKKRGRKAFTKEQKEAAKLKRAEDAKAKRAQAKAHKKEIAETALKAKHLAQAMREIKLQQRELNTSVDI